MTDSGATLPIEHCVDRADIRQPCAIESSETTPFSRYNSRLASGAAVRRAAWEKDHAQLLPGPHRWPKASSEAA